MHRQTRATLAPVTASTAAANANTQARRAVRVARGLADPVSRPRYVAAARKRLRGERTTKPTGNRCQICGAPGPKRRTVTFARNPSKVVHLRICRQCGFISIPENTKGDYRKKPDLESLPLATRAGTHERKGREYYMAKMALDILDRPDLEVLVYGAGRSFDNVHIEALPRVRNVAIGDIMRLRDDADFVDANEPAARRFPIVIASEVIEHFRDPWDDFIKLFNLVERDGLVVCGTNIYAGGDLSRDRYLFYPDHTSYYTPQALRLVAQTFGYHLDFRAPLAGSAKRKRYVLFSKSRRVMDNVADYFGSHMYAPSEPAPPKKKPAAKSAT